MSSLLCFVGPLVYIFASTRNCDGLVLDRVSLRGWTIGEARRHQLDCTLSQASNMLWFPATASGESRHLEMGICLRALQDLFSVAGWGEHRRNGPGTSVRTSNLRCYFPYQPSSSPLTFGTVLSNEPSAPIRYSLYQSLHKC